MLPNLISATHAVLGTLAAFSLTASCWCAQSANASDDVGSADAAISRLAALGATVRRSDLDPRSVAVELDTGLGVHGQPGWEGEDGELQLLTRLRDLSSLQLRIVVRDQESLRFLKELKSLTVLHCSGGLINNQGIRYLEGCSSLEEFGQIGGISDAGFNNLTRLNTLRRLNLWCPDLTDEGTKNILKLDKLTALSLAGGKGVTDKTVARLCMLQNLKQLNLNGTGVTETSVRLLKDRVKLEALELVDTKITKHGIQELRKSLPSCHVID